MTSPALKLPPRQTPCEGHTGPRREPARPRQRPHRGGRTAGGAADPGPAPQPPPCLGTPGSGKQTRAPPTGAALPRPASRTCTRPARTAPPPTPKLPRSLLQSRTTNFAGRCPLEPSRAQTNPHGQGRGCPPPRRGCNQQPSSDANACRATRQRTEPARPRSGPPDPDLARKDKLEEPASTTMAPAPEALPTQSPRSSTSP